MKKLAFIAILGIFTLTLSVSAQNSWSATRQERGQASDLKSEELRLNDEIRRMRLQIGDSGNLVQEIKDLKLEIKSLVQDSVLAANGGKYPRNASKNTKFLASTTKDLYFSREKMVLLQKDTTDMAKKNLNIRSTINSKYARLAEIQRFRQEQFDKIALSTDIPKEMGKTTMQRRQQSNVVRREELTFQKLANNPVIGDSSGYQGIIKNMSKWKGVTFRIVSKNGGESKSFYVGPNGSVRDKLIPGIYTVSFLDGNKKLSPDIEISSGVTIDSFDGEPCHWFAYWPGR